MSYKELFLEALETEKEGDWANAHLLIQAVEHEYAYWIHAYLHRKEPDISNARYWYSRAGKKMPDYGFDREWEEIYDVIDRAKVVE